MSPTILRKGPYRFYFFSNEGTEPPHIHIKGADGEAKFWLNPVVLAYNHGYAGHELGRLEKIIEETP